MGEDIKRYRKGVGVVLLQGAPEKTCNPKSPYAPKVFVAQRLDSPGAWQMPQGGIDKDESPLEAMLRELEEETSIKPSSIELVASTENWLSYDFPSNIRPQIMGGRYWGQKQKWFLARFLGPESSINLETKEPEFTQWQWVEAREVPNLIVEFKRSLYQEIMQSFAAYIHDAPQE